MNNAIRKFFRQLGVMFYSQKLSVGESISVNTFTNTQSDLPNVTILISGNIQVTRPDGSSYQLAASTNPVDMTDLLPGQYLITALDDVDYRCVGPIVNGRKRNDKVSHTYLGSADVSEGYSYPAIVMSGSVMIDNREITSGETIPANVEFVVSGNCHLAVLGELS